MAIDKSKYVVLDIETNGLYVCDDILTISLYKPDDELTFNKYLPLELSKSLNPDAVKINGIQKKDLAGATPLSQQDVDDIFKKFELDKRIILTYGEFDKRMLKHYFKRKGLKGFEFLNFYNFKRDIISSRYSEGNVTKDNLCNLYHIDNVLQTHSSLNDCILEWKLFERMDEQKLLITNNKVFEMNKDYIIPISYFSSHPNLERHVENFPYVEMESKLVKRFELSGKGINRFATNTNGLLIEHLINTMLNAEKQNSLPFLLENKSKLTYLGKLPSYSYEIPLFFKEDGTVKELNPQDKDQVNIFNQSILILKPQLNDVIDFIKSEIFNNEKIMSQELVINKNDNILALCDLSSENVILEIKTNYKPNLFIYRNQLYYEANGRKSYILQVDWSKLPDIFAIEIFEVYTRLGERPKNKSRALSLETVQSRINNKNITLLSYTDQKSKVTLKCKTCNHEWQTSYNTAINSSKCPICDPIKVANKKSHITEEEKKKTKASNYAIKVLQKSNGCISANNYTGSRDKVTAQCLKCGYKWDIRSDHLLERPYCTCCKANKLT